MEAVTDMVRPVGPSGCRHAVTGCSLLLLALTSSSAWQPAAATGTGPREQPPPPPPAHQANNNTTSRGLAAAVLLGKPDFFLLGAMKAATTSMHKLMKRHPEICAEGKKEKHFFDTMFNVKDAYKDYLREFEKCEDGQFTLDSTPAYIRNTYVPERVRVSYTPENLKKKKFMLILREPVSRHYSEYQMRVRVCLEYGDLADKGTTATDDDQKRVSRKPAVPQGEEGRGPDACEKVTKNYVPGRSVKKLEIMSFAEWTASEDGEQELYRGHYLDHVKGWTCEGHCVIDRSQLFIMNFESLISDSGAVLNRLGKFLGLKEPWEEDTELPETHKKKPNTVSERRRS